MNGIKWNEPKRIDFFPPLNTWAKVHDAHGANSYGNYTADIGPDVHLYLCRSQCRDVGRSVILSSPRCTGGRPMAYPIVWSRGIPLAWKPPRIGDGDYILQSLFLRLPCRLHQTQLDMGRSSRLKPETSGRSRGSHRCCGRVRYRSSQVCQDSASFAFLSRFVRGTF